MRLHVKALQFYEFGLDAFQWHYLYTIAYKQGGFCLENIRNMFRSFHYLHQTVLNVRGQTKSYTWYVLYRIVIEPEYSILSQIFLLCIQVFIDCISS